MENMNMSEIKTYFLFYYHLIETNSFCYNTSSETQCLNIIQFKIRYLPLKQLLITNKLRKEQRKFSYQSLMWFYTSCSNTFSQTTINNIKFAINGNIINFLKTF